MSLLAQVGEVRRQLDVDVDLLAQTEFAQVGEEENSYVVPTGYPKPVGADESRDDEIEEPFVSLLILFGQQGNDHARSEH